ncbi:MAG: sn-glycerol-3-phosphate ABC transporter ATP-binding protein UgpC [Bauldia sp.]|uniref:ABC transporter ATP-binding protein n=1 Tax=Bauldia sp. TaxID=2575872 RepID=UPI001D43F0AC|nr:sn-glycerol-3-phosphate ABC transporter ATP-binding protein UgpC [Bauldia sp.]MCB1494653.1 sn-glycerol-3-phosphate ABC transporter ATP-binding protein UgpC [Bauldia sp.]
MASITLDKITKTYPNDVTAVNGVSLDIRDGEFMIFLGPSGCGKSTTLRMIAGLEAISSGDLLIGGRRVNEVDPADRDIAIVFQNYALYPHMTVARNLAFGLRLRHVEASEIQSRITRVAALLGIEPLLSRKPSQLSGGQRQRVALGRALVREPQAFLLDEPLSNLDATLRASMRTELIKLHNSLGTTIVHVTHDQVEAMTMGERICIMRDGDIVQVGAPMEVYRNPADTFVASFLATPPMNLLPGRIESDGDGLAAVVETCRLPIPAAYREAYASHAGKPVIVGLRPEDFQAVAVGGGRTAPVALHTITTEVLGPEVILVANFASPGGPEVHIRMPRDFRAKTGETVTLHFDLPEIQVFDPGTTRVLARPFLP